MTLLGGPGTIYMYRLTVYECPFEDSKISYQTDCHIVQDLLYQTAMCRPWHARQPDHMLPAVPNAYLFTPQGGALMHSNYVSVFHQFQVSTIFPVAYPTRFNPLYSKDYRVFLENAILPTVILPGS